LRSPRGEAGVAATVFMPLDAPMAKVDATRSYGAEVLLSGEGFDEAQGAAHEREAAGATFVHAFEDEAVVAWQGTLGLELARDSSVKVETLVVPIGGGGLASGIRARPVASYALRSTSSACRPRIAPLSRGLEPSGITIAEALR
jgi:threonine dehydratase